MGIELNIYIGKYLRVWLPEEEVEDSSRKHCPKCDEFKYSPFCDKCGSKTLDTTRMQSVNNHEIFEAVFGDYDIFHTHKIYGIEYEMVFPNSGSQSGGSFWGEDAETPYPNEELNEDWLVLMASYKEIGIKYKIAEGVVVYYN